MSGKGELALKVLATFKVIIVSLPLILTDVITPVLAGVAPKPLLDILAGAVGQVTYIPIVGTLFNKLEVIVILSPAFPPATA